MSGLAYVAELSADGGNPSLYALCATDGTLVWRYQTSAPSGEITAIPAVDGGTVYFGTLDGSVYAVGAADGKLRWRRQGIGSVETAVTVSTGLALVSTVGGDLFALHTADGSTRWHTDIAGFGGITVGGNVAFVGVRVRGFADSPATGAVFAINASDGTTLWTVGTGAPATTPALARD
jgi:outer membrane protein assembly factor BamB